MTRNVKGIARLVRSRLGRMSPTARRWAVVLVAAAVVGVGWLAMSGGGDRVALNTGDLDALDVVAAKAKLTEHGISPRIVSGRLMVSAEDAAAARAILAGLSARPDHAEALTALAKEDDIWRTTAQSDKRWQAAKMSALSRLVETFPSVASATVLYEPGNPRGLGGGQEPTAAVKVTMKPGATLTRSVAGAIADLISGSVAGMSSRDVRVVDGSGRSYRFDAASEEANHELQQRRAVETYYHEKIHEALGYIDNVVISVSVPGPGDPLAGLAVFVAVPRSHLASLGGVRGDPSAAEAVVAGIRRSVLAVADRPCQVTAEWYYDGEAARPAGPAAEVGQGSPLAAVVLVAAVVLAAAGGGAILVARRHGLRRSVVAPTRQEPAQPADADAAGELRAPSPQIGKLWDFLGNLTTEEIVSLVAGEHPQTTAIVLGQLPPAKAAAVLAGLDEETQPAVGRRVAVLHQVDPVVIAEVGHSLADRAAELAKVGPEGAGPEGRVAEILRHSGMATERAVLSALAGQAPGLAEAVRRQMFRFEDIAQLPPERLRAGLAAVETTELAVALRTAGDEVKAKVFGAMSGKAARRVREEMDRMVPVRLTEVEAAQQRVAEAVRRAESGEYLSESAQRERQLLA